MRTYYSIVRYKGDYSYDIIVIEANRKSHAERELRKNGYGVFRTFQESAIRKYQNDINYFIETYLSDGNYSKENVKEICDLIVSYKI